MVINKKSLNFNACVELVSKLSNDFITVASNGAAQNQYTYQLTIKAENSQIARSARVAALKEIAQPTLFKKIAFDTRRIDQEHDRIPRTNLQYWNRSQAFIDEEDQGKIDVFAKLLPALEEIKSSFGTQPEYFNSYSRILHDSVNRILRVKEADLDIFRPQLAYLEQLMFARYRLSMEDINKMNTAILKEAILKKDENLLKRGSYLQATSGNKSEVIIKDGDNITQNSIVNAIFGNTNFRRDGEKTVERTITITIKDNVLE